MQRDREIVSGIKNNDQQTHSNSTQEELRKRLNILKYNFNSLKSIKNNYYKKYKNITNASSSFFNHLIVETM